MTATQITQSFHPFQDIVGAKCPAYTTRLGSIRLIQHYTLAYTTRAPNHLTLRTHRKIKHTQQHHHYSRPTHICITRFFPNNSGFSTQDVRSDPTSSISTSTKSRSILMSSRITPQGPVDLGHSPKKIIRQALGVNIYTTHSNGEGGQLPRVTYCTLFSRLSHCLVLSTSQVSPFQSNPFTCLLYVILCCYIVSIYVSFQRMLHAAPLLL